MKNQINISNLTPEQIEDLRQQLKAFDEQPKTIMDKVKTWQDANRMTINKIGYFINTRSQILSTQQACSGDYNKNIVPSEKHAKSILATCQLMVIADALNEGSIENRVWVHYDEGEFMVSTNSHGCKTCPIRFANTKLAYYTITQFPELWYDYFMIDKPTKQ